MHTLDPLVLVRSIRGCGKDGKLAFVVHDGAHLLDEEVAHGVKVTRQNAKVTVSFISGEVRVHGDDLDALSTGFIEGAVESIHGVCRDYDSGGAALDFILDVGDLRGWFSNSRPSGGELKAELLGCLLETLFHRFEVWITHVLRDEDDAG